MLCNLIWYVHLNNYNPHQSYVHNDEFLEVIELTPDGYPGTGIFYAPDKLNAAKEQEMDPESDWQDTESFRSFSQKSDKHQLGLCSVTREMIFFLPSKEHQSLHLPHDVEEHARVCLTKSLIDKPNQINSQAKKRKVHHKAHKWVFWGKLINFYSWPGLGT